MDEKISNIALTLDNIQGDNSTPAWAKILINCVTELISVFKQSSVLNDRVKELESENVVLREFHHHHNYLENVFKLLN